MLDNEALPLVSICIPAYNHERYVQEAIQSVIDQDYPRIELIVIDDGSSDSTWMKIQDMRVACEKRFERVVMITRQNRGRVATAREMALLQQGEFVGGLASDDVFLPGAILKLVQPMIDDASIGVTVGTNVIIDSNGVRCYWDSARNNVYDKRQACYFSFDDFLRRQIGISFDTDKFGSYELLLKDNHIPNGQLHRRSVYKSIVAFDDQAPLEDLWINLQLAKATRFKHVDAETFCYRWHGGNTVLDCGYMIKIRNMTYLRELKFVEDSAQWGDFLKIWMRTKLPFKYDVCRLSLGRLYLGIIAVRMCAKVRYLLAFPRIRIPITFWMRVK